MHRPTAAAEAATLLLDMSAARALPFNAHNHPEDDLLTALTRRFDPTGQGALPGKRLGPRDTPGPVRTLPPVLVPMPEDLPGRYRIIGQTMERSPDPQMVADEWPGFPYPVGIPLDAGPRHLDRRRGRRLVVAGPDATPTPHGSLALTVSTLAARAAAEDLDRWAATLPASAARRVEAEAATYLGYATEAEALLGPSFAWADELDNLAVTPAFQTVPVTLRGYAYSGV